MNATFPWRATLLVAALCVSAFLGARTVAEEQAASNFDRDVPDFDHARDQLAARLSATADTLKQLARDVPPQNAPDEDKKALESKIGSTLQAFFVETYGLALQTHILSLDSTADHGGQAAEGAIIGMLATKLKAPIAELVNRKEKSGLGIGGVFLGYAIASAAKVPADEIFTNKQGSRSWSEIMRDRQVTLDQLKSVLEEK